MASRQDKRVKELAKKKEARLNKEVLPSFKYLITLMYDGSNYGGYAKQKHKNTIQDILNIRLKEYFKQNITTIESSRTDAKVHALDQKVMFTINKRLDVNKVKNELNQMLPNDIIIKDLIEINKQFHCRYDVKDKTYIYTITNELDPRYNKYKWYIKDHLDIKKMQEAANMITGVNDYKSFQSAKATSETSIRTINYLKVEKKNNDILIIINADGFLYNMVRLIVKALVDVGLNRKDVNYLKRILDLKEKPTNLESAPAQGLCLTKINYKKDFSK